MSTETSTPATTRIGDADRDLAVEQLAAHYAEGRLDRTEFDERSAAALTARTRAELVALFVDLPSAAGQQPSTVASPSAPRSGADSTAALVLWREGAWHNWLIFCLVGILVMATTGQAWMLIPMTAWGLRVLSSRGRAQRDPQGYLACRSARRPGRGGRSRRVLA